MQFVNLIQTLHVLSVLPLYLFLIFPPLLISIWINRFVSWHGFTLPLGDSQMIIGALPLLAIILYPLWTLAVILPLFYWMKKSGAISRSQSFRDFLFSDRLFSATQPTEARIIFYNYMCAISTLLFLFFVSMYLIGPALFQCCSFEDLAKNDKYTNFVFLGTGPYLLLIMLLQWRLRRSPN